MAKTVNIRGQKQYLVFQPEKDIYATLRANIILNGKKKKKKTFSKIKSKTKMFILITSLQHEVLSKGSQARKGNKKYSDWKEEIILYLPML